MILLSVWFGFFIFKVEEQQKKALEEDPTIFDYDGVYDKMKEKVARPLIQDREERKVRLQILAFF
jgi:coiled-coil domain-containing protein 55